MQTTGFAVLHIWWGVRSKILKAENEMCHQSDSTAEAHTRLHWAISKPHPVIQKKAGFLMEREHIQATCCCFTAIKCEFFDRQEVNHVLAQCFTTQRIPHQDSGQPKSLCSEAQEWGGESPQFPQIDFPDCTFNKCSGTESCISSLAQDTWYLQTEFPHPQLQSCCSPSQALIFSHFLVSPLASAAAEFIAPRIHSCSHCKTSSYSHSPTFFVKTTF